MCGIFGVFHKETPVFQSLIDGITLLQHKGQDSSGIASLFENRHLYIHKNNGTVHHVFSSRNVLKGKL
jgi:amidophosphoribosyltransferase